MTLWRSVVLIRLLSLVDQDAFCAIDDKSCLESCAPPSWIETHCACDSGKNQHPLCLIFSPLLGVSVGFKGWGEGGSYGESHCFRALCAFVAAGGLFASYSFDFTGEVYCCGSAECQAAVVYFYNEAIVEVGQHADIAGYLEGSCASVSCPLSMSYGGATWPLSYLFGSLECVSEPTLVIDGLVEQCLEVQMYDSWGDGWNGNSLHVGSFDFTLEEGFYGVAEVCLPPGTYEPYACGGPWVEEVKWVVGDLVGCAGNCMNMSFSMSMAYSMSYGGPTPQPNQSPRPTAQPSPLPTAPPTMQPMPVPTKEPTPLPTPRPTSPPSLVPSEAPTAAPSLAPSPVPSAMPSAKPTPAPSQLPSGAPTPLPSASPSFGPTPSPTPSPSQNPSPAPSATPSEAPTPVPSSSLPTPVPTQLSEAPFSYRFSYFSDNCDVSACPLELVASFGDQVCAPASVEYYSP